MMASPFPGMDPYLEQPGLWPDVRSGLVKAIQALLNQHLHPRYFCGVEEHEYVAPDPYPGLVQVRVPDVSVSRTPVPALSPTSQGSDWPDEAPYRRLELIEMIEPLREPYLVIRAIGGADVVTVIEVLSPANKAAHLASGREYREKRREFLLGTAHLVEIDLLRAGDRPVAMTAAYNGGDYYGVYLNRAAMRTRTEALLWPLSARLPIVPIPLTEPDPAAKIDLQAALDMAYDWGAYDARIDYRQPPWTPLSPENVAWAESLIGKALES